VIVVDALGSSEAVGMAASTIRSDAGPDKAGESADGTASFRLGAGTRVITEDGRDVGWGTGERGMVAMSGHLPIGYYKDEAKSAATFKVIDGVRYTIPGDWATVDADGTVHLLGRGSQCINTGGEKVYPEEVEEALKRHPAVADAAVVGIPDDLYGEAVTALIEPAAGAVVDERALIEHVRTLLAAYKSPKRIITVATVNRSPSGKLDYRALRAVAEGSTA